MNTYSKKNAFQHIRTNLNKSWSKPNSDMTNEQNKLDWDKKREEILEKTNNDPNEIKRYVLNEKNTRITKKFIEEMLMNYGINYKVHDIGIFIVAMTHPAYTNQDFREMKNLKKILMGINFLKNEDLIPISPEQKHMAVQLGNSSYERLEYLGDSILRLVISDYLLIRYKNMDQGDLTKLRSQIENGLSLAEISRIIGLPKYLLLPRNMEATGAREKIGKLQCDIFEAFIAAIYYDSMGMKYSEIGNKLDLMTLNRGHSFDLCFRFMSSLIEDEIDLPILMKTELNYKDELLKHYHKLGWSDPKYNIMDHIVDENKMGKVYFKMYVRDNDGNIIGNGIGSSKKKGEKIAAKKALQYLKVIPDDNEDIILNPNSPIIYFRHHKQNENDLSDSKSDGETDISIDTCSEFGIDGNGDIDIDIERGRNEGEEREGEGEGEGEGEEEDEEREGDDENDEDDDELESNLDIPFNTENKCDNIKNIDILGNDNCVEFDENIPKTKSDLETHEMPKTKLSRSIKSAQMTKSKHTTNATNTTNSIKSAQMTKLKHIVD